jgi:hypothetical protein
MAVHPEKEGTMARHVVILAAALLVTACSPLTPRRLTLVNGQWTPRPQAPISELQDTDENLNPKRSSDAAKSIAATTWEHYDSFDVGIIEFTEWGGLWGDTQRTRVVEEVRRIAQEQGSTVVVYAHGWHHSARWNDTNLVSFRHVLRFLARQPQVGMHCTLSASARHSRVVGIYIGWRGESLPLPGANLATIFSRKRVAQAIGGPSTNWEAMKVRRHLLVRQSQLANVLRQLETIRDEANRNANVDGRPFTSLTITGHSLGGAMLLSAMQQIVFNKTIDDATPIDSNDLHRVGDAVILLNPAVEASRYKTFRAQVSSKDFDEKQRPILLVLSSDGDTPNKIALKIARVLVTAFTPRRWRDWRDSTTALGFSLGDISHRLAVQQADGKELLDTPLENLKPAFFPDGISLADKKRARFNLAATRKFGRPLNLNNLSGMKDFNPFMVIRTDKAIIRNHNDIFSSGVMSFLIPLVTASERKGVLPICYPEEYAQQAIATK